MISIRQRLTRRLLLAIGLPIVGGGVVVGLLLRNELVEQFDSALLARALGVAAAIRPDGDHVRIDSAPRFMRAFEASDDESSERGEHRGPGAGDERDEDESEGDAFYQVWRVDGTALLRSASLGSRDLPFMPPADERHIADALLPGGLRGRAVSLRFRPAPSTPSDGLRRPEPIVLLVAASRRDLDQTIDTVVLGLIGCSVLVLAVTVLVVPRVVAREFEPIAALADQAARITADSLSQRFTVADLPSELAPVGGRLNNLLERLESSFARERRFSADLAHELRTPLAELRSLAEVALKWPEARAAATDRDVLDISTHMEGIVVRLLALARADHATSPLELAPVRLAALLADIWTPLNETASARALRVSWEVDPDLTVASDEVMLRAILTNLLQNSVDYASPAGTITVTSTVRGDVCDLRVANSVDGFSESDVAQMFDRFWRRDPSRTGSVHAGLGLSLARSLSLAVGATLVAELEIPRRLTLVVGGLRLIPRTLPSLPDSGDCLRATTESSRGDPGERH
jgi:signal transduction histidine kinase